MVNKSELTPFLAVRTICGILPVDTAESYSALNVNKSDYW